MRILNDVELNLYRRKHSDASRHLNRWQDDTEQACWTKPEDIDKKGGKVRVKREKVRADIRGKRYKLLFIVDYHNYEIFMKDFLTHTEYDRYNDIWEDYPWYI